LIRLLLRLPIVLLLVAPLTWVVILWGSDERTGSPEAEWVRLADAYPRTRQRETILRSSAAVAVRFRAILSGTGPISSERMRAALLVSLIHSHVLVRLLPLEACLLAAGVVVGLIFRERMRSAEGYASPTAAGLGRGLVGAGLIWCGLFALTPLPVSSEWLYGAILSTSIGGGIYAANLPLKL